MAFDLLDIQNDVYKYEANEGQMKEVAKNLTHPNNMIYCAAHNKIFPEKLEIV